mgnify:CR=1 FL=1
MEQCYRCRRYTNELSAFGFCTACSIADSMKEQSRKAKRDAEPYRSTPSTPWVFKPIRFYIYSGILVAFYYTEVSNYLYLLVLALLLFLYVKLMTYVDSFSYKYQLEMNNSRISQFFVRGLFVGLLLLYWYGVFYSFNWFSIS